MRTTSIRSVADFLSMVQNILLWPERIVDNLSRSYKRHRDNITIISTFYRHAFSAYKNYCLALYSSRFKHDIPATLALMDKIAEDMIRIVEMGILPEEIENLIIFKAFEYKYFIKEAAKKLANCN